MNVVYLQLRDSELVVVFGAAVFLLESHHSVHSFTSGLIHHLTHILLHLQLTLFKPGLIHTHDK